MLIFKAGDSNNTFLSFDVFMTNVEETIKVQSFRENIRNTRSRYGGCFDCTVFKQ